MIKQEHKEHFLKHLKGNGPIHHWSVKPTVIRRRFNRLLRELGYDNALPNNRELKAFIRDALEFDFNSTYN